MTETFETKSHHDHPGIAGCEYDFDLPKWAVYRVDRKVGDIQPCMPLVRMTKAAHTRTYVTCIIRPDRIKRVYLDYLKNTIAFCSCEQSWAVPAILMRPDSQDAT